jgi:hypothetical protein
MRAARTVPGWAFANSGLVRLVRRVLPLAKDCLGGNGANP